MTASDEAPSRLMSDRDILIRLESATAHLTLLRLSALAEESPLNHLLLLVEAWPGLALLARSGGA